jgi:mono/diheme cytochrome c family protein
VLLAALGFVVFWLVGRPRPLEASAIPKHTPDIANGERLYNVGGCHSCHKPGPDLKDVDAKLPAGGAPLKTPIGTLYPPNLTPDPETGLGRWSDLDFVNAMQRGLSPGGEHLVPAFPYTSYAHMRVEDVLDIKAYLATFAPVKTPPRATGWLINPLTRRAIGAWKLLGLDMTPWQADPSQSPQWNTGSYFVSGPGHCGECHTPRNIFMASDTSRRLAGGPHPEGTGKVPSLRDLDGRKRYKDVATLVDAFQLGELGGYDRMSSGGMGAVQTNLSKLPKADLTAIATYLMSLE